MHELEEKVAQLEQLLDGMTMAFMVILSSHTNFTFTATNDLLRAFPFSDYKLVVRETDDGRIFTLIGEQETRH